MNILYSFYYWLPNFARLGYPGKAINYVLRVVLKKILDKYAPAHFKKTGVAAGSGINAAEERERKYIVSLTSFPARIDNIWICIETILRQSFKPDAIILWLAEEQFPDRRLPQNLLDLQQRGLTIEYCKDLRSHKKYHYAILRYPNDYVITLDDDLYYHKDVLKNLIELQRKFPDMIVTNRAHRITFDRQGHIMPYSKWRHNDSTPLQPSKELLQTGGAGTLYLPGSLHPAAFDEKLVKELCFHADDIWLKLMTALNGYKVVTNKTFNKDYITISSTQNEKLVTQNVFHGGNDKQLQKVIDHFNIDVAQTLKD